MQERAVQRDPGRSGFLPRLAVWAALLAAGAELASIALRRLLGREIIFVGRDVWWTVPLVNLALFLAAAVVLIGLRRWRPTVGWWRLGLWGFTLLGVFAVAYDIPGLHRIAALLLAGGLATQAARWAGRRREQFAGLVHLTLPPLLLTALAGALLTRGLSWWGSYRQLAAAAAVPLRGAPPNVLLIVLDTVRDLNLSLYGYARETTPQLTRWAGRGVRFEQAFSTSPWTLPGHASMLTGRFAHELSANWFRALDGRFPTLAEVLARHGYQTAGFIANTDYASAETGLARGFASFDDYSLTPGLMLRSAALGRAVGRNPLLRRVLGAERSLGRKDAPEISRKFLDWIGAHGERPWFVLLNYYDAHRPYQPPEPWFSRFAPPGVVPDPRFRQDEDQSRPWIAADVIAFLAAYDGAIAYLDDQIGRLLAELEQRGVLDRTLVIITSDHGEEFDEHELFDHGHSLYLASVRVPLLVLPPGERPAAGVVAVPVSLRSLPATVFELTGLAGVSPFPGRSLAPLWRDSTARSPDTVSSSVRQVTGQPAWFPASQGDLIAVLDDSVRYLRVLGTGREEAYAYRRDPGERQNLILQPGFAAVLGRLRRTAAALVGPEVFARGAARPD